MGIWGALLFMSAGRWNWARGWIYLGVVLGCVAVTEVVVAIKNPGLLQARGKRQPGAKRFDKIIVPFMALSFFLTAPVIGLDAVRFGWSHIPAAAMLPGILLFLAGFLLVLWPMTVNPFMETHVRIQDERGHAVVDCGPYALIRHPMYAGIIVQSLGAPLICGSLWSCIPIAGTIGVLVLRTALEDRTLRHELAGYKEYATRVRYRLLPGIW
jgi:protein-S-isoprenylcysteine O-methyltransferase Ste14